MKEQNTDELISKYLAGEAGPEEAMELEDWKELSAENMAYYMECERLFFAAQHYKTLSDADVQAALVTVKSQLDYTQKRTPVFRLGGFLKIAAAIVLLVGAVAVFNYFNRTQADAYTTYAALDTEKKVELEDKSAVVIDPNSSITVDKGFGKTNRRVTLTGSAYFEVTHTEELPLVVDAGQVYIKDIGTKFRITTSYNKDTVTVAVDEGIVLLYDSAGAEITLQAGQHAVYIKSQKKIMAEKAPAALNNITLTHQSLKEVADILSTAFNASISIENKNIENCRITARFSGETLETVLDVVTETLGLTYTKTGNEYIIKGNRCNN